MKKSNIFAYVEMKKLVDYLNQPGRNFRESLVAQAAYFRILDPRYFSEELGREWNYLRSRIGYPLPGMDTGLTTLKSAIQKRTCGLSDDDCRLIHYHLNELFTRLSGEFED